jgi:hypothetical protein
MTLYHHTCSHCMLVGHVIGGVSSAAGVGSANHMGNPQQLGQGGQGQGGQQYNNNYRKVTNTTRPTFEWSD